MPGAVSERQKVEDGKLTTPYYMKVLHIIVLVLLIAGGLNWGLTAFDWNVVDLIFGKGSTLAMVVYILIGLAALYEIATHKQNCKVCSSSAA